MSKILIATDLSKSSNDVFSVGFDLARRLNSGIVLVTIINELVEYVPMDIGISFADQWEARLYIAQRELNRIKSEHADLDIEIITFVGDPKKDVIEQSIKSEASYIVLGTHGRTGLSHMVMGSTAEYVIRHSTVPVVVVPYNRNLH